MQIRWMLAAAGVLAVIAWFATWAMTVVPETSAVTEQWAAGNFLAFLAGGLFGAAACVGRNAAGRNAGEDR